MNEGFQQFLSFIDYAAIELPCHVSIVFNAKAVRPWRNRTSQKYGANRGIASSYLTLDRAGSLAVVAFATLANAFGLSNMDPIAWIEFCSGPNAKRIAINSAGAPIASVDGADDSRQSAAHTGEHCRFCHIEHTTAASRRSRRVMPASFSKSSTSRLA